MADTETNTTAAAATPAKDKTTLEGMTGYRTFDSTDDASKYLQKCATDFSDFDKQPFAMIGLDDEGNFKPDVYTPEMRIRVAVLRNVPRTVNGKREPTTIKAIVVTPVPSIPALLGIDATVWDNVKESPSVKFLTKTMDKELNHIAVRPLREAENLDTAIEQVPTTIEDFITSGRDSGGIMDTFNDLYKTIGDKMKAAPIWAKTSPNKADLRRAMESTAYANEYFPQLEDRGEKESLFVTALRFGQVLAKHKGMAPDIFDKWLATRDSQTLKASEDDEDSDDLSLDDLTADMVDDEPETPEATEAETAEAAPAE